MYPLPGQSFANDAQWYSAGGRGFGISSALIDSFSSTPPVARASAQTHRSLAPAALGITQKLTMDASELVDLAAAVSGEGFVLLSMPGAVSSRGMADYWAASKCRQQRWSRRLANVRDRSRAGDKSAPPHWSGALPIFREILASEILTRVCVGFSASFDRMHGVSEAEPLSRSIYLGHLESRHSVLRLIASAGDLPLAAAKSLDQLRRAAERWSDLLVGPFMTFADVTELAHNEARLLDFAEDAADDRTLGRSQPTKRLWSQSRIDAFATCRRLTTFNSDLNAQIAASLLTCFNLDGCDEQAPALAAISRSLLTERLSTMTADAEHWIAGLLAPETDAAFIRTSEVE